RCVLAEPADVVPVDPGVVARLDAVLVFDARLEGRAGHAMQLPAFRTVIAGRLGAVEHLALAAVELAEMAARERGPEHAVAVDVAAAAAIARQRRRIDFRELRLRIEAHDVARERGQRLAPHRAILRID